MKSLDRLAKRLPQYTERYVRKVVRNLENKINLYMTEAYLYVSDVPDFPECAVYNISQEQEVAYEINVIGRQVAFVEFGTGVYNPRYSEGISVAEYQPSILYKVPPRGSYGKGKGRYRGWAFYPQYRGDIGEDDIYIDTTKKGTPLRNPVIFTRGLKPSRAIYRAIQETMREERSKKR